MALVAKFRGFAAFDTAPSQQFCFEIYSVP